jgi:hypothetical protein
VVEQHPFAGKNPDKWGAVDMAPQPRWPGRELGSSASFSRTNLPHSAADPQHQTADLQRHQKEGEKAVYAKSASPTSEAAAAAKTASVLNCGRPASAGRKLASDLRLI